MIDYVEKELEEAKKICEMFRMIIYLSSWEHKNLHYDNSTSKHLVSVKEIIISERPKEKKMLH